MAKIGVDVDEVLSGTVGSFLRFYNAKHGTDFAFESIHEYSFWKQFGITPEDEVRNIKEFFASEYFPKLEPIAGSQAAVTELCKNHDLYAVTSRPQQLADVTNSWLEQNYPGCFKEVILTNSHFDKTSTKSAVCLSRQLNVFIDDQVVYAEDCASVCSQVFLLDKPWNQIDVQAETVIRVSSWAEIVTRLFLKC